MKKLMWVLVFLCLSPLPVSTAMAGRTDRLCYDFDARTARVKERIAWNEKMLYDDLAGLKQDKVRTQRNPRLALADEKLSLAIQLCNDALNQVQILRDRVPREIDCGERHRAVRREIDAEVMALNDVEGKISNLNIMVNQYRTLRLEAASIIQNVEGGSRY
jgi:ABC-type phosphate transport system auxiliary subunit